MCKQFKENIAAQLDPIYTEIKKIDTQFSVDDANRYLYKLPSFTKPQTEPMDEEITKNWSQL